MVRNIFAKKGSKVVSFEQGGHFYYRMAQKYIDSNNYIDALNSYRKAVDKDPENVAYRLDLAEVFTEMSYYDESNRILFFLLQEDKDMAECYFGLGCNFLGLQEYKKAEECLQKYLQMQPDGIYSEDADDLLDALRSYEYYTEEEYLLSNMGPEQEKLFRLANKGKNFLDRGEYKKAIRCMENASQKDSTLVFARNNLALAYFCIGKLDKAIEISRDILIEYPYNIHATCNLAVMLHEKGNDEEVEKLIKVILGFKEEDPQEIHKIAVTLCELNLHKEANQLLKILLQYKPYDVNVLHYVAVSYFNTKLFKEAISCWDRIEKISPDNMISSYYKKNTQNIINGDKEFKEMGYHFQVPYDESLYRVKKINDLLKLPVEELIQRWQKNDWLKGLLSWGLGLNDVSIKKAILNIVASLKDQKAEYFLREFTLKRNIDDDIKKNALMLLSRMGAREPYIAYMDDNVVEINSGIMTAKDLSFAVMAEKILDIAITGMKDRYKEGYEVEVRKTWTSFISGLRNDKMPKIKKPEAWAAALELYHRSTNGYPGGKSSVVQYYDASYTAISSNYAKLLNVLQQEDSDDDGR